MVKNPILKKAEDYVRKILIEKLSTKLLFHNFSHTERVVKAVQEICFNEHISPEEEELVTLAAWFHDIGQISAYQGHESISQKMAEKFLKKHQFNLEKISIIIDLIGATAMPQTPQNQLQQIICDADLYHLSAPEYCKLQELLRREWSAVSGKQFPLGDWQLQNIAFLVNHKYFTPYAKRVWTLRKEENIERCKKLLTKDN